MRFAGGGALSARDAVGVWVELGDSRALAWAGRWDPAGPGLGWPGGRRSAALCPQDSLPGGVLPYGHLPRRRPWCAAALGRLSTGSSGPRCSSTPSLTVVNMVSSGSSLTLASFVLVFFVGESGLLGLGLGPGGSLWAAGEDEALEEGSTPIGSESGAGGLPRPLPVCAWGPVRTGSQPLRDELRPLQGLLSVRFLLTCKKTISWVPAGRQRLFAIQSRS